MDKIWKFIDDDKKYRVSNYGDVESFWSGKPKPIKISKMTSGYFMVVLKINKSQKCMSLHRLLAIHFIPNPENKPQVNHINGIKTDNRIENLEWCTLAENVKHAYETGLKTYRPLHYKGKFGKDHNRSIGIKCVESGIRYGSIAEASRETGMALSSIHYSMTGKRTVKGLTFIKTS